MTTIKLDIETLEKYIIETLELIKGDAPSLGGFSSSVIELLGRFLQIHQITIIKKRLNIPNKDWFYDFIEGYLGKINPKYYEHKYILWKLLRCESAHAVLATSAITFSLDEKIKNFHLKGHYDLSINRNSLIIRTSQLAGDLKKAVSMFFNDVKSDPTLEKKCQKSFLEIYNLGQDIIKKEIRNNRLLIELETTIRKG